MKQEIGIGAKFNYSRFFYENLLRDILGSDVTIRSYNLSDPQPDPICPDIFLISTPFIANEMKSFIHPTTKIIPITRTFSRENYRILKSIPSDQDILVVNNGIDVTFETIALIYALGFNFKLYPHYPDSSTSLKINTAITTNEVNLVPDFVAHTYNIGHMVYSLGTINEILENLSIDQSVKNRILYHYEKQVVTNETGIHSLLGENVANQYEMQAVLDLIDEGVLRTNNNNHITMVNDKAAEILDQQKEALYQQPLNNVLQLPFETSENPVDNYLIHVGNEQLILSSRPTHIFDEKIGSIVTLKKVTELRKLEEQVRQNTLKKGHTAKYTFDSILGSSLPIEKAKNASKKMAAIDSTIVITGESGTGKELFAQAIHNESKRQKFPFIAINCAALPESLIESELFGYESGAFTGASKSGRSGLFEDAHLGTLFLDEIGDLSLPLQAKLLRVLESQEVIRLGSNRVRSVDVRIIAATNKNLLQLAQNNEVRWDFYYRLNVFPLHLPTLRERKEDIPVLFQHLLEGLHCHKKASTSLMDLLITYDWPGNIRELRNVAEYLSQMSGACIQPSDLPPSFLDNSPIHPVSVPSSDIDTVVLLLFLNRQQLHLKTGRKTLLQLLKHHGFSITERFVRNQLTRLESEGLIIIGKGRQGSSLTQTGFELARQLSANSTTKFSCSI